jgi:predicted nucleotidyltransferase
LAEHGIVSVQEAGNMTLYSLNREHLAAPAVEQLMALRDELVRRLAEEIASWSVPVVHASLFGSAARGDGDVTSDIDLFVVRPRAIDQDDATWRSQLDRLATEVVAWTGNHAGFSEVGERDLAHVRTTNAGKSIHDEGITLAGEHIDTILGSPA